MRASALIFLCVKLGWGRVGMRDVKDVKNTRDIYNGAGVCYKGIIRGCIVLYIFSRERSAGFGKNP